MAKRLIMRDYLKTSTSEWKAKSLSSGTTYYSDAFLVEHSELDASLLILTTGSLDVSYQVSDDGVTFYDPYTTDGSTAGELGSAVSTNRYIVFTLAVARYMRFKVVANAAATVSAIYYHQEYA